MATESGIFKQVAYKKETVYGTVPAAASAQALRRVSSSLDLKKATYKSNEIRPDFQTADMRHGIRTVDGAIQGELSAKTYSDFIGSALKKLFVAGVAVAGASITIGGSAGAWTITRAAGSFLTDGFKIGDTVRLSVGALNAANLNKNIFVTSVTALVLTGIVLNASALVAEGPIGTTTVTVVGKKSLIPQTGHIEESYSIEHWFPNVPTSEVFSGCKVEKIAFGLPPTGMATVNITFAGKDATTAVGQYFTSPTGLTSTGLMASVNGVVRLGGATVANVTGLTLEISSPQSGEATVGSNTIAAQAPDTVTVSGSLTLTFDSTTHRDAFYNETEMSLFTVFTADNTAAADIVGFSIPRFKYTGAARNDGGKTLTVTAPFMALLNITGGAALANDLTTISVQDSAA